MKEQSYTFSGTRETVSEQIDSAELAVGKSQSVLRSIGCLGSLVSLGLCAILFLKASSPSAPPNWAFAVALLSAGAFLAMTLFGHKSEPDEIKLQVARSALEADIGEAGEQVDLVLDLLRANATPALETWMDSGYRMTAHRQEWLRWLTPDFHLRIVRHLTYGVKKRNEMPNLYKVAWYDVLLFETEEEYRWTGFEPPTGLLLHSDSLTDTTLAVRTRECSYKDELVACAYTACLEKFYASLKTLPGA